MEIVHNGVNVDKLNRSIYTRLNNLNKRGVSYIINVMNDNIAIVTITVAGKKGVATQTIVVQHNTEEISDILHDYEWYFHTNKRTVKSDNLASITQLANKIIVSLKAITNKFS